jgi:hypothetical protein
MITRNAAFRVFYLFVMAADENVSRASERGFDAKTPRMMVVSEKRLVSFENPFSCLQVWHSSS